jgi:RNA polymerase primary sigma factor
MRLSSSAKFPARIRWPEMERGGIHLTKEAIRPNRDETSHYGRSLAASQSREEEAPELLAGYLGRISRGRLLTPEEELDLGRRTRAGDAQARAYLIEKNLGLVVQVAKRYREMGMPFEDLIQEGNLGLMKATDKFDPEMGYRFSTYAIWWIRQAVGRALEDKGRAIRLSAYIHEKARKAVRTRNELSAQLGREPTDEEVAEKLGWTVKEVRYVESAMSDVTSLNQPVSSDVGSSEVGELVEDERTSDTPGAVMRQMQTEGLRKAVGQLPERQRYVLARRYGLDERDAATLAELSDELGISLRQVRQLQRDAERRLRGRLAPERCRKGTRELRNGNDRGARDESSIAHDVKATLHRLPNVRIG